MPWPNQLLIIILEICGRKLEKLEIQLKLFPRVFSNKYNELYNSVRYEQHSLNDLFVDNKYDIQAYCIDDVNNDMYNHTHYIDVNQIMSAVHKLKPGKSDCIDNMYSDNLKKLYIYVISYDFYFIYFYANSRCISW